MRDLTHVSDLKSKKERCRFITEDVGLLSGRSNISLSDLNRSIGRALAAIAWYGKKLLIFAHCAVDGFGGRDSY